MAKKLQIRDLRISFRTVAGKVQAVRGISLDLEEGETVAIVGESGSGKSVTSKAILGILAGNSVIEGGEIIYDGKDLLKIPEEELYKIRGDKIAMIFQDPLSSLNPIMRIGRQLTEAMLLKGRARQKASRTDFNSTLCRLRELMIEADGGKDPTRAAKITEMCRKFNRFEFKHIELERAYREARSSLDECLAAIENVLFLIEKNALRGAKGRIGEIVHYARKSIHGYVVSGSAAERLTSLADSVMKARADAAKKGDFSGIARDIKEIGAMLNEAAVLPAPNFFCMGYYLTFSGERLPELPIPELNAFLRRYLDEHFMLEFIDKAEQAIEYSARRSYERKEAALLELRAAIPVLENEDTSPTNADALASSLIKSVSESIDRMEIVKDGAAYTFEAAIRRALATRHSGEKGNADGEELRSARKNAVGAITRVIENYEVALAKRGERNYRDEAVAVIDYLKQNASGVVNRITRAMARTRAIKLLEEVGIAEPRKRYMQYPFELSGGMRQRIVIAIALAADPDVLICDEPTTALDVTIQAQILELINKLKRERRLSIIFITHDLGVVANMADRIAVMYAGKIVEYGTARDIFYSPAHPYTWALLSSMPDLDTSEKLEAIPGTPPNMIYPPVGDAFADRNKYAMRIDFEMQPPMFKISDTHSAATWLLHPDAPRVEPPRIIKDRIERMKKMRGEGR